VRSRARCFTAASAALFLIPPITAHADNGDLADKLRDLSIQYGTGVLFAPGVVAGKQGHAIRHAATIEQALDRMLAGSGLAFRRTSANTIVIYALSPQQQQPDLAIPDILVTGRHTQDADIRRSENDIQPYQVLLSDDIAGAEVDTVDQLLRSRLNGNEELAGPSQDPSAEGSNRSEINLHAMGIDQTLVLVDGARMPGIPNAGVHDLIQPDINGIPLLAIDRVESLAATAGGIYGPGATGGVVNVVLKRDYRGIDLVATNGVPQRGDAPNHRIDLRIGFTPDHGDTDVMLTFSRSVSNALAQGSRSLDQQRRTMELAQDPLETLAQYPTANGVIVRSASGGNLALANGTSLGSSYTYLPLGPAATGATLLANAGTLPAGLAPDGSGAGASLVDATRITALFANIRHRFGDTVEAFVDLIGYQNNNYAVTGLTQTGNPGATVSAGAPTNPFGQAVLVSFPAPGMDGLNSSELRTFRASGGVIARLPFGWKADATYALGGVRALARQQGYTLNGDALPAFSSGLPGAAGEPVLNPFGPWSTFLAALQAYRIPYSTLATNTEHFHDATVRLAGKVATLPAGPIALTLLAERLTEQVATGIYQTSVSSTMDYSGFAQSITSFYGELRVPVIPRDSGPWPLRGLELQWALRDDADRIFIPQTSGPLVDHQAGLTYTAGLRVYPGSHLMLRASAATGILPATADEVIPGSVVLNYAGITKKGKSPSTISGLEDPERGDRVIGTEGPVTELYLGSPTVHPATAQSLSIGLVVNPEGQGRPRIAIDFTHTVERHQIVANFSGDFGYFLANAALYPGRVVRAPLTAADRAAGFTGGVITEIDASFLDTGATWMNAVDLRIDHTLALGLRDRVRLYAGATWEPTFVQAVAPGVPQVNYVGYLDGPQAWRANAGAGWTHGPFALALDGTLYSGSRDVARIDTILPPNGDTTTLSPDAMRIPLLVYLNLSIGYKLTLPEGPVRHLQFQLKVADLLDRGAAITDDAIGYAGVSDPRGRCFEFSIAAHF
jgi:iron complex outermembrane recepter protein